MFSRFLKGIGNVVVHYLQNESSYMIVMIITYVGFMNDHKGEM
jgi:hypothetical protein